MTIDVSQIPKKKLQEWIDTLESNGIPFYPITEKKLSVLADILVEGEAADKAHKKGLTHAGGGRWKDNEGNVVAKTVDDKLVAVKPGEEDNEETPGADVKNQKNPAQLTSEEIPKIAGTYGKEVIDALLNLTGDDLVAYIEKRGLKFMESTSMFYTTIDDNGQAITGRDKDRKPFAKTSEAKQKQKQIYEKLKSIGIEVPLRVTNKKDSVAFKPPTLLGDGERFNEKVKSPVSRNTEKLLQNQPMNLGQGKTALKNISERINASVNDPEKIALYSDDEKKRLKNYTDVLKKENVTADEIAKAFETLISDPTRGNEIHKNFAEIHCATLLAITDPDVTVLMPVEGQAPIADILVVRKDKTTEQYIVEAISVKAQKEGAPSSAPQFLKAVIYKENKPRATVLYLAVADVMGGSLEKFKNKEDTQLRQYSLELINEVKDNLLKEFPDDKELQSVLGNPEKYDTVVLAEILLKNKNALAHMVNTHLIPYEDEEKTRKQLKVSSVNEKGTMATYSVSLRDLLPGPAKREGQHRTFYIGKTERNFIGTIPG